MPEEKFIRNVNTSALGKGLASLIPKNMSESEEVNSGEKVLNLLVDKITPNPYQPRKEFKEEQLQELADSIRIHGILEPILVSRKKDGEYELVAGERRLRAAKLAKLKDIPAIVREATERQKVAWALTENLQRSDLSIMDEVESYHFLQKEYGLTQEDIVNGFSNRSRSHLKNIMRLINLPEVIKNGIRENKLTLTHAMALLKVPDKDLQLVLYQLVVKTHMSIAALEEKIGHIGGNKIKHHNKIIAAQGGSLAPEILELEEKLSSYFSHSTQIIKSASGAGKIVIPFRSAEELKNLTQKILR